MWYTIDMVAERSTNYRDYYDERGKLLPGHPGLPGGGRPKHGTNISEALKIRLDAETCQMIADMLVNQSLEGNIRALEIVLDRSEGKVAQQITTDSEIIVVHGIPRPVTAAIEAKMLEIDRRGE